MMNELCNKFFKFFFLPLQVKWKGESNLIQASFMNIE